MASKDEIDRAYAQRSAAIISAALAGDIPVLSRFVSEKVDPTQYVFDTVRPAARGPLGLVQVVKRIAPRRYTYLATNLGSLGISRPCGEVTVNLWLFPSRANEAYFTTFRYEGGILAHLDASYGYYVAAELSSRSAR